MYKALVKKKYNTQSLVYKHMVWFTCNFGFFNIYHYCAWTSGKQSRPSLQVQLYKNQIVKLYLFSFAIQWYWLISYQVSLPPTKAKESQPTIKHLKPLNSLGHH